jgi:hypothetical protein
MRLRKTRYPNETTIKIHQYEPASKMGMLENAQANSPDNKASTPKDGIDRLQ